MPSNAGAPQRESRSCWLFPSNGPGCGTGNYPEGKHLFTLQWHQSIPETVVIGDCDARGKVGFARAGIPATLRNTSISSGVEIENIHFCDIFFHCRQPHTVLSAFRGVRNEAIEPIRNLSFPNSHGFVDGSDLIEKQPPRRQPESPFFEDFESTGGGGLQERREAHLRSIRRVIPAEENREEAGLRNPELRGNTNCPGRKCGGCRFGKSNSINGEIAL